MNYNLRNRLVLLLSGIVAWNHLGFAADPKGSDIREAMEKAVGYFAENLAVHGGYASAWSLDGKIGFTEHGKSPTVISIQPSGTTTVGLTMLEAYQASGNRKFFDAANGAARALIECQLESGGWPKDFDFDPKKATQYYLRSDKLSGDTEQGKRKNLSTLDDNKTQSALLFLIELAAMEESDDFAELHDSVDYAVSALFSAQAPNGGWPQQFDAAADPDLPVKKASYPDSWPREYPREQYHRYYTLNDNNLYNTVELLIRAWRLSKKDVFLDSAKKAGDFLLLAQMPEPQPAWAQQYNFEMEPVWARKFEPASICSVESFGVCIALFDLWVATGEEKYRAAILPALDWLEKSRLPDGRWSRFYELKTNRPLYCEADRYKVTYDDSNLPTHYGFKIDSGLANKIERMRKDLDRSREEVIARRSAPDSESEWAKEARSYAGKARAALKSQEREGYWVKDDRIDATLFVKHMRAMASYLEAVRKSGKE